MRAIDRSGATGELWGRMQVKISKRLDADDVHRAELTRTEAIDGAMVHSGADWIVGGISETVSVVKYDVDSNWALVWVEGAWVPPDRFDDLLADHLDAGWNHEQTDPN